MPILTDLLSPDVIAATLEMIDARDVLRTIRAVPTLTLPPAWEFQARRPLREIEQLGFVAAGVRLRLWPTCQTLPNGLLCLHREDNGFAMHEDIHGELYMEHSGPSPFHCWEHVDNNAQIGKSAMWRIVLMNGPNRSRLRAMRECDDANNYDYDAPYQQK